MDLRDWALIIFTILMQMAVGSLLVLQVIHYYVSRKASAEEADQLINLASLALVPVVGVALLASLFHLGNPINAPRAIIHLATSWLSREVLCSVIFSGLVVVFAFLQWRRLGSGALREALGWITSLLGLLLVFIMSNVYTFPTQPAWDTPATPVSFFVTTLLLGCLAVGATFVAGNVKVQSDLMRRTWRGLAGVSIILLGIEFAVLPIYAVYLATAGSAAVASATIMINPYGWVLALRLILAFIGAGVFGTLLYENAGSTGKEKALGYLAYSAFGLVLIAEVLGRFLFYASQFRIGI